MRISILMLLCAVTISLPLIGCSNEVDRWQKQILAQNDPDQRREAVVELMDKGLGKSDKAVQLFATLAQTDSDPTVRSAATQALGESANPSAVAPLAQLLADESDARIRCDAAVALGKVRGPQAVRALLDRLRGDQSNEVRSACARTLGQYRYPGVVQALVAALLSEDFSVAFEARRSLEKLTRKSFESSQAWQNWLDKTGEPFAAKGSSHEVVK